MGYARMFEYAQQIKPDANPEDLVETAEMRVKYVASCLLRDASEEELLHGRDCPVPEHLTGVIVRLAEGTFDYEKDDLMWEVGNDETVFDLYLDEWGEWCEYCQIQAYVRKWGYGDLPDWPEPVYDGPFEEEVEQCKRNYRKAMTRKA